MAPSHSCQWCRGFIVYLFDEANENRADKPVWKRPNPSQDRLAATLYGDEFWDDRNTKLRYEFYQRADGISFFDASLRDMMEFAGDGCSFAMRFVECLTKVDEFLPQNFVLGVNLTTAYSLELGYFDTEEMRWEMMLGGEADDEPDNTFTMLAERDDPVSQTIQNCSISQDPGAALTLSEARCELNNCLQNHETCGKPDVTYMPTRLIELSNQDDRIVCRLRTMGSDFQPYAALSYCWGGDQTFKTTMATISKYQQHVPEDLPQTLLDAISMANQLGIKYIWIDALCIIQDSKEDKAVEIGQMSKVYSNATVTVAATRASAVWEGFLSKRPALGRPDRTYTLSARHPKGYKGSITLVTSTFEHVDPLDTRGWCFQERVLSPRILDFGSLRTQFTCRHVNGYTYSDGWSLDAMERAYGSGINSETISRLINGYILPWPMQKIWLQSVAGFSSRGLGFTTDKLPAIAGLAESFGAFIEDDYRAGLWSKSMPKSLLWRTNRIENRLPSNQIAAPSWSWAAVPRSVIFDPMFDDADFYAEVRGCTTNLLDSRAPYAAVTSGKLTLVAHAQLAQWAREGVYDQVDILRAVRGIEISQNAEIGYPVDRTNFLGFRPDAIEQEFREDAMAVLDVHLLLFGFIDPSQDTDLFPTLLGIVLRSCDQQKDTYSRVGMFQKTMNRNDAERFIMWMTQEEKKTFVVV